MTDAILFFPKTGPNSTAHLPMSLLMVAAPLVEHGYEVKIIDQRLEDDWQEKLASALNGGVLLVGFSVLTGKQILYGLEASKFIKENSNAKVVWGGVHPSLLPRQTLENHYIDFVIIGEGEQVFERLLEKLKNSDANYSDVDGLGYKKDSEIYINEQKDFIDLNALPSIPYNLVEVEKYVTKKSFASGNPGRNVAIYTSRGCPHRCAFCYNLKFNKRRWRGKSAEKVIIELGHWIDRYNINAFEIEDDEFFVDLNRVREICLKIIEKGWQIEIFSSSRVNYLENMDDDFLKLLFRAGFKTLSFGVESGSPEIQKEIHKDITNEQVFSAVRRLGKAGINSKYYFMCGFPGESIGQLYETIDLIYKMKQEDRRVRIPPWRIYTPYHGTELYEKSILSGWHPPKNLKAWANYDFETANMPWLNRKKKVIIKNAAWMSKYVVLDNNAGGGIKYKLGRLFGKWIDFRWRHHWFFFAPERSILLLVKD
ncbi:B12-binding domain-containing radical SAM protein [Patescibacteria group bacterium]|nr:B12-binding domain-containing radical SAM protein [Patescibacteria group bacterium]